MSGVRSTVYLPDELVVSARMLEINVSEVAQRALRAEVGVRVNELRRVVQAAASAQDMLRRLEETEELDGVVTVDDVDE
jgi:hypothetical protein